MIMIRRRRLWLLGVVLGVCCGLCVPASAADCDCECPEGEQATGAKAEFTFNYEKIQEPDTEPCSEWQLTGSTEICGLSCFTGGAIPFTGTTTNDCLEFVSTDVCGVVTFSVDENGAWTDVELIYRECDTTNTPSEFSFTDGGDSCTSYTDTYTDSESGVTYSITITLTEGECVEAPEGTESLCDPVEDGEGDPCDKTAAEDADDDGGTENASSDSVAYLTGHKIERATDIAVSLPGRDFKLLRETTSDTGLYHTVGGEYYWGGRRSDEVTPGTAGAHWALSTHRALIGDDTRLYLTGIPMRTMRVFEIVPGEDFYVARASTNQYIFPAEIDDTQFGDDISVYRLRKAGGVQIDFAREPDVVPNASQFGIQSITGLIMREQDASGNIWSYEYDYIDGQNGHWIPILKHIYLNWDPGMGSGATWAARVDFTWYGESDGNSGTTLFYEVPQFIDTDSDTVWDPTEEAVHRYGRVAEVKVVRLDGSSSEVVTQKARYLYFEDLIEYSDGTSPPDPLHDSAIDDMEFGYQASKGDLCEVITSTRVHNDVGSNSNADDDFYDRVTQYRYYGDNYSSIQLPPSGVSGTNRTLSGEAHQLLAVIYPEQIEYYADYLSQLAAQYPSEATSTDIYPLPSGWSPVIAARRLRWLPMDHNMWDDLQDDADELILNIPGNTHWTGIFDLASKVIGYYTETNYKGRVKTQIVTAGDGSGSSCGCSATSGLRLGKRLDYLYKRYNWETAPDGVPSTDDRIPAPASNGYSCQIVESWATVEETMGVYYLEYEPYRVHCHDYFWLSEMAPGEPFGRYHQGVAWKVASARVEADSDWDYSLDTDPSDATGRRWVTMYEYSTDDVQPGTGDNTSGFHKVARVITPGATVSSEYDLAYDEGDDTESAILPSVASSGLVHVKGYSTSGWKSTMQVADGDTGTPTTLVSMARSATRSDLVTIAERFPGEGPTGDTPSEKTVYSYGYHNSGGSDPDSAIVAWRKATVTAETSAQNGPSSATTYISYSMYDKQGQLRWDLDEGGTLTYYEYDEDTGTMTLVVRDADPDGDYVDDDAELANDFPSLGTVWPTGSITYEELEDSYVVDELGRVIEHTDAGGVTTYAQYELRETDNVNSTGELADRGVAYMATLRFPHKLSGTTTFAGPVSITWSNAGGKALRTSSYIADGTGTYDPSNGDYNLNETDDEVQRSDTERMISGLTLYSRVWHDIGNDDALGTHKDFFNKGSYVTYSIYDTLGRPFQVDGPEGGITRYTGYDILDRPLGVIRGAYDAGSPQLETVSQTYYDSPQTATQGVGNGNVTYSERFDGEGNTRVTKRWYDYRDRLTGQLNPEAPHTSYAYDNLNRVVEQAAWSSGTGEPSTPDTAGATRSTYSQTLYNNRGMVYRTRTAIDPTQGSPSFLESNRWFDEDGLAIASWSPNQPATKTEYDALDRPSVVYQTDRYDDDLPGSGSYTDASSISDDHVISQVEYRYVANGDPGAGGVELITNRSRLHDADESGGSEVAGVLDGTSSIATYVGYAYDDAGRQVETFNYGTNDADFEAGTTAPTTPFSSTGALVSSIAFDEWGRVNEQIDPEGKSTRTVFDDLSRQIAVIESAVDIDETDISWDGTAGNWAVTWPGSAPADQDRVTTFTYDGNGNVLKRTAHINGGDVQVTQYEYGTVAGSSGNAMDSLIESSNLLSKVHYPNESTGEADTASSYTVSYAYNRLGELRGVQDQNGTTHAYTRDDLGRITEDAASNFGTNIDQSVQTITAEFDDHGRLYKVESLDGPSISGSVVNGVEFSYNKLHQIKEVMQNASGIGSSGESVVYDYDKSAPTASGGNYTRVSAVRYPAQNLPGSTTDTVQLDYTGVINDRISRVNGMDVPGWISTADDLVRYSYLGMSTPVKVNYPSAELGLDYTKASDGSDPTDMYPGFDQYGRVVWHAWVNDGFQEHSTNTGYPDRTPLIARHYEYDDMSNRTRDWDGRPGAVPADRDWRYDFDGLDRLETAYRGQHTPGVGSNDWTSSVDSQMWTLDMLGNWEGFITDLDGDELFEAGDETEERTFNLANEILTREGEPGSGGGGSTPIYVPSYDAAGNLWKNSSGTNIGMKYYHDAWNRLVRIDRIASGGDFTILENEFNGLNRRVVRRIDTSNAAYDGLDEERLYFYNHNWQFVEEHVDNDYTTSAGTDYKGQQFWGVRYIDDAVAKRIDRDNDGDWNEANADNYHYLTDVMFSVRVVTDRFGYTRERVDYTPYGVATHRYAGDVTGEGTLDINDTNAWLAQYNYPNSQLTPGDSGYSPYADLNGDGNLEPTFELTSIINPDISYVNTGSRGTPPAGWLTDPARTDGTDNAIGYDGYLFDLAGATDGSVSGVYMVRHRVYDPGMGRWLERDPYVYADGNNQFSYCKNRPTDYIDVYGLAAYAPVAIAVSKIYMKLLKTGGKYGNWSDCPNYTCKCGFEPVFTGRVSAAFAPNGCGLGGGLSVMLDLLSGTFDELVTSCCNKHDLCYVSCGANLNKCNTNFRNCMFNKCLNKYPPNSFRLTLCLARAADYTVAVSGLPVSHAAFCTSQAAVCKCKPCYCEILPLF